ncbi:MAG TPA: translational machinery protein [Polyangia bacterium]|nr:translational machinery protein [Polyangia bacterium]
MTMDNTDNLQMAVWIDHNEARVFVVDGQTFDESIIQSVNRHVHRHPKSEATRTRNHPQDELRFFDEVVRALAGAAEILVMGPSVTKLHFLRYAQTNAPAVAARVVGLETADNASDRQLAAHVRHYFHKDRARLGVTA